MTNKEKYELFCAKENSIPIFSRSWWLDSVCGRDNWDVCLVEKGGQIVASLPYYKIKKTIFDLITMPKLTQTLGVYIKYPKNQKYYKKLSFEKEVMTKIINRLPKVDMFSQNFHYSSSNWLPFYWKGYSQTIRYTYIIQNVKIEDLINTFENDIRRRIKKGNEIGITIFESSDIETFYKLNKQTFSRQNKSIPYSLEFIKELHDTCVKNDACKMYFAKDIDNNIIAANFLVYDDNTVYYLMGGIDPEYKNLGGMDLILFESIKFAIENNKIFDFEGSMVESIEKYFRSFGAIQQAYSQIFKYENLYTKIVYDIYRKIKD